MHPQKVRSHSGDEQNEIELTEMVWTCGEAFMGTS